MRRPFGLRQMHRAPPLVRQAKRDRSELPDGPLGRVSAGFRARGRDHAPAGRKLLAVAGEGRGLISICAAGGQGVTAILER